MAEAKFCTACGCDLQAGMRFCPQCGQVVAGSDADEEMKRRMAEIDDVLREGRMNWIFFAIALYAIPVTIAGLFALIDSGATASTLWSNVDFQNWISTHGYDITLKDVETYVAVAAGLALASGACAMVSMFLVFKRKRWSIAVIACLLASALCFWSVFGLFIGLLMTWMLYASKESFD